MSILDKQRRFAVDAYHAMADTGVLAPDERVELLEGVIVPTSPIGERHASCVIRLSQLLHEGVRRRANVSVQSPLRIDEHTELQPDLMLLACRDDFCVAHHPGPGDVLLLNGVSVSTVSFDRTEKCPNLPDQCVERYSDPRGSRYDTVRVLRSGMHLTPAALADLLLPVQEVLA